MLTDARFVPGFGYTGIVGAMLGLLHASFTASLSLSQHVTVIGITLLASSLSYYITKMLLPASTHARTAPPKIVPFQNLDVPFLSELPFVGVALFSHTSLTYAAFLIVPVVMYVLYRTPWGLTVRIAEENPVALEAQGINVVGVRTLAVMLGSALMAVVGAALTISAFDAFYFGMVNGRGWICIALVIFASWRPGKALLGALLFFGLDAFQARMQQQAGAYIHYQFFLMLPYVLSIVARRAEYPRALLKPYRRGERL